MDDNKLLKFALAAGEIMLASGAETVRVEDTMLRILSTSHSKDVEALAVNTFLIVSIPSEDKGSLTLTRGVRSQAVNFQKVCGVNDISRSFVSKQITLEEAISSLDILRNTPSYSPLTCTLSYGFAAGGFAMVLGAIWIEGLAAFLFGTVIGASINYLRNHNIPSFFHHLVGGAFAGASACAFHILVPIAAMEIIIIGIITPLLPGRIMTNSIRDMLEGNFISGTTRLMESFLVAFSIAIGVGFGVSIFI